MNFTQINTTILNKVLKLSERKDALLQDLSKIEKEIQDYLEGKSPLSAAAKKSLPKKVKQPRKEKQRKKIKESILAALTEAGSAGIRVTELADKLGLQRANVHAWFSSFGKKMSEIERIAPGHFRLQHKQELIANEASLEPKIESFSSDIKSEAIFPELY